MGERFPFPIPRGWYQLAYSDEIAAGELQALHYFDSDLVVFRGASGKISVLDAHCPHLGAHFGFGGRVVGEHIRCPFHGWCFDGDGKCVDAPYAARIPPGARVRAWLSVERNGMVMAWYDPTGGPPQWDVPEFAEYGTSSWTPYWRHRMEVATCNQEIIENAADRAHFRFVHGTVDVPNTTFETDGPRLRSMQVTRMRTPRGTVDGGIESIYHGLGYGTARFTGICEALLVLATTPITDEKLDVRFSLTLDGSTGATPERGVGKAIISDIIKQFVEDTPIWENKQYQPRPIFCDGDGPIARYRAWAQQFY